MDWILRVQNPDLLSKRISGKINAQAWKGEGPHEWLCIACNIEPTVILGTPACKIDISFQHNPDTWDKTLIFEDEVTGKPPAGVTLGSGIMSGVQVYEEVNFEEVLGVKLLGG